MWVKEDGKFDLSLLSYDNESSLNDGLRYRGLLPCTCVYLNSDGEEYNRVNFDANIPIADLRLGQKFKMPSSIHTYTLCELLDRDEKYAMRDDFQIFKVSPILKVVRVD